MTLKRKWQLGDIVKSNRELVLQPFGVTDWTQGVRVPKGYMLEVMERKSFLGGVTDLIVGRIINGKACLLKADTHEVDRLNPEENALARLLFS